MSETQEGLRLERRVVFVSLLACLVLVLYLAFLVFRPFLLLLGASLAVALLLAPVYGRLKRLLRGRGSIAAFVVILLVVVVLLLPLLSSTALLAKQTGRVVDWVRPRLTAPALEELLDQSLLRYPRLAYFRDWLNLDRERLGEYVSTALSRVVAFTSAFIQGAVARLGTAFFELILFLVILFFLLRDGHRVEAELRRISPFTEVQERALGEHLSRTVKGVLLAMVAVPLAQGILAMVGFSLFGLPSPLFWGAVLILAALVPGIGSPLVWLPAAIYLLMNHGPGPGIGMLLYGTLVISTIDNLIKPLLLHETAGIHPLLAFLATLGGLLQFGPLGFLIGPLILSLLLSAIRIYRLDILRSRNLPPPPGEG